MFLTKKQVPALCYVGTLCIVVLAIVAVFSNFNHDAYRLFFNSDSLYLPSIYKDIFVDRSGLQGWNFSPAPGFFPDLVLYSVLMLLVNDFIVASFLYAIIQFLCILLIILWLFRTILPGQSLFYASIVNLVMILFFLAALYSHGFNFTYYLLTNAYHLGTFVMALICITLAINYLQEAGWGRGFALMVCAILSIISDRLFIVMFSIPVSALFIYLFKSNTRRRIAWLLLMDGISLIIGLYLLHLIKEGSFIRIGSPHRIFDFGNMSGSLDVLFAQLWDYMNDADIKSLILAFSVLSYLGLSGVFFSRFRREESPEPFTMYSLIALVFIPAVLFAPVVNGNYTGFDTIRYIFSSFILSMINIGIVLVHLLQKRTIAPRWMNRVVGLMSIFMVALVIIKQSHKGLDAYLNYYPGQVAAIDSVAGIEGLEKGVGGYWNAKLTSMFSKKGIRVYAVFDAIIPYHSATNENWFYREDALFNFIILDGIGDTTKYKATLGEGKRIQAGGLTIVKLAPFRFDRATNKPYFADSVQSPGIISGGRGF
jgi:hypothetical protein